MIYSRSGSHLLVNVDMIAIYYIQLPFAERGIALGEVALHITIYMG